MKVFKKALSLAVCLGMSGAIIFFLSRQVDGHLMLQIVKGSQKWYLLLAFLVTGSVYVLALLRWQMLLRAASVNLPLGRVVSVFAGGTFFNLLPLSIGGDFLRSVDLSLQTQQPRQVVATVLLDRLSGYVGLVVLTLVALIAGYKLVAAQPRVMVSVSALLLVLICVLVVLFNRTVYEGISRLLRWKRFGKMGVMITNLHREVFNFSRHRDLVVANIALSILVQAVSPVVFLLIGHALGIKVPVICYFIFLPIIGAVTMLPISIAGLGVRDAMVIFFFSRMGVVRDLAFAMSLLSFFFILIYGFIGGLIYVFTIRHRRVQPHTSSAPK